MSQVRFYVDEDAEEHAVVLGLRARGVDLLTTSEAHRIGATDAEQLVFAVELQRTLYSFNVGDFCRLHSQWLAQQRSHAGIVLAQQQQFSLGEQIRRLARLIGAVSEEEMRNRLAFLGDWG